MSCVKGGTEIFTYDFTKGSYGYCQLNSPIIAVSRTESVKTIISFHALFDVGPFFVYGEIVAKDTNDLAFTFSKRFIEKDTLEKEKLLTLYDPIFCKWNDTQEHHPGLILHTSNYLQQVNLVKYGSLVTYGVRYKLGDIIHLNGSGFVIGKKGDQHIYHMPVPLKVSDLNSMHMLYT